MTGHQADGARQQAWSQRRDIISNLHPRRCLLKPCTQSQLVLSHPQTTAVNPVNLHSLHAARIWGFNLDTDMIHKLCGLGISPKRDYTMKEQRGTKKCGLRGAAAGPVDSRTTDRTRCLQAHHQTDLLLASQIKVSLCRLYW